MCTYNIIYVFPIIRMFHHKLFLTNSQLLSLLHCNAHVDMNKFLCSLSCTWMAILDCLFYAFDSLS